MFTSLRVNKVEFTLSQCTICYDMSLITLLSHLLGAFEGFQNYNLIKINTKHASYKTGSRKKIILSAQCLLAFNTSASKNFRLAQGSLAIRFWIECKPYVKRYFNANYVILSIENDAIQFKTLSLNSLLKYSYHPFSASR